MKNLTINDLNTRQLSLYNQFKSQSSGRVAIEWHSGDPRAAYRYYRASCRTHKNVTQIGRSNGCSASRGNYHSTWAVEY
jgi:hypothetical protein